ncbi:4Fe-4S dicluster domain-containing protein [Adlercreutzia caecimuris]|uniref:4Fe-4S dicluster domain-containing protein n=1 Tax=Adlercreutzia caecimuris TaxID=671266 RepID=UPI00272CA498|nr:4Fe-4S dicluster domain-containing protein [Adlercreutzia caecimuris]
MGSFAFAFHADRCTGCKTCTLACKDYYNLDEVNYRTVYEYGGGGCGIDAEGCYSHNSFLYYVSVACNHCENPACARVCPTGAMHKEDDGRVLVHAERCIGCGYCVFACPYGAPKVDREVGHSVKCTGCADRAAAGLAPICVEACPLRALEYGEAEQMAAVGERAAIAPLPAPDFTTPNMYVKACASARPCESTEGSVQNKEEVR